MATIKAVGEHLREKAEESELVRTLTEKQFLWTESDQEPFVS